MPTDASAITREHVESFIEDQLGRYKLSTAATRYRDLQQFFKKSVPGVRERAQELLDRQRSIFERIERAREAGKLK